MCPVSPWLGRVALGPNRCVTPQADSATLVGQWVEEKNHKRARDFANRLPDERHWPPHISIGDHILQSG